MNEQDRWHRLFQMTSGSWVAQAIYIVAKLRIADHLKDSPCSADELASQSGVAPRALYRVLRALVGVTPGSSGRPQESPNKPQAHTRKTRARPAYHSL